MSALRFKGNWNIVKGKFKQKFARLTGDDLRFTAGKENELTGRIQKRAGQSKKKITEAADQCYGCHHYK
ncbi:MAG: CsbD family protein [Limisphaerales bacterium]